MNPHDSTDGAFREGEPPLSATPPHDRRPDTNAYHEPMLTALLITIVLVTLCACNLDFGESLRLTAIGLTIFWGWVFYARWRRPAFPTKWDLFLIKWGSIPLIIGFQAAMHIVWHLRGLR